MARILVVDDSDDVRTLLSELLEFDGHEVATAENGAVALMLLEGAGPLPEVLVLDITMPVMDGFELLRRLAAQPRLAAIPVIVSTAAQGAERSAPFRVDVLPKPLDLERLSELIELRTGSSSARRSG